MFLNNQQLFARNQGYNSNRAGESLIKACSDARTELYSRLKKPHSSDVAAFEAFILEKIKIRNMDHNELREALKA